MDITTRIIDLTVGEFQAIIAREVDKKISALSVESRPAEPEAYDGPYYGIKGMAEALHCSRTTAQEMKRKGLLEGGYQQMGRNIIVRSAQALRDTAERSMKKKRR